LVRQLRLRNIGGIIIIDFIDMEQEPNRDRVFSELSLALEADRARTNILKISELGLVEMTRKRVRESLVRSVSEPCFYCDGTGLLKSRTTVILDAYRALVREADAMEHGAVRLSVHPRVAELLLGDEQSILAELEDRTERQVRVEPRPDFHLERYEFSAIDETNQAVGRRFTPHDTLCG
jgi:ribonuclease G